jgi:hypothetical protein
VEISAVFAPNTPGHKFVGFALALADTGVGVSALAGLEAAVSERSESNGEGGIRNCGARTLKRLPAKPAMELTKDKSG